MHSNQKQMFYYIEFYLLISTKTKSKVSLSVVLKIRKGWSGLNLFFIFVLTFSYRWTWFKKLCSSVRKLTLLRNLFQDLVPVSFSITNNRKWFKKKLIFFTQGIVPPYWISAILVHFTNILITSFHSDSIKVVVWSHLFQAESQALRALVILDEVLLKKSVHWDNSDDYL